MNLTFDERMLMTLYNAGTRDGTIKSLSEMRKCLQSDEIKLRKLIDSALSKLEFMTEDEFERAIFKGMEDVDADEI